jgi:hypothetical protein
MAKAVERLLPLATATQEIESDHATLLTVHRFVFYARVR